MEVKGDRFAWGRNRPIGEVVSIQHRQQQRTGGSISFQVEANIILAGNVP